AADDPGVGPRVLEAVHQQRQRVRQRKGDGEEVVAGDEVVADLVGQDGGGPGGPAFAEGGGRDGEDAPGRVPGPARAEFDADAGVLTQAGGEGGEVGGVCGRRHAGPPGPKNIPHEAATSNPTRAMTLTWALGRRER